MGSKDGYLRYYNSAYGLVWSNRRNSNSEIDALDFSPNGSYLVASSTNAGKRVSVWTVSSNSSEIDVVTGGSDTWALDWSNDSSIFAKGTSGSDITTYNGSNSATFTTQVEYYSDPGD